MPSNPRVLFFHGLESGINGRKAMYLAEHFPHTYTPNLKPYYLLPLSLWKAIAAIYRFEPDIIVGSSFGAFIAMFLLQTRVWNGHMVLLAPATGLLFKKRLWLPADDRRHIVIVAGRNDTTVPLDLLVPLEQSVNENIRLLVVEDSHQLNQSMIVEDQLRNLIYDTCQFPMTNYKINNYFHCTKLWLVCIFHLVISFVREPLTLYKSVRNLRRARRERSSTD